MKRKQENKNKFRRIFGVFGVLSAMVALVVAGFAPMVSVRAIENQELYAKVMMRGAIGASNEGGNTIFEYDGGTVNVLGLVEPVFEVMDWDYGDGRMGDMYVFYTKGTSAEFVTSPSQGYIPELWINGQMEQLSPEGTYVKNNLVIGDEFGFEPEFQFREESEPGPQGNTEAVLRVHGGEGSFDDSIYDEMGNLIEERTVQYADTYTEGSFSINDGWFYQLSPEDAIDGTNYSEATYRYDDEPENDSVVLGFATLWHMRYVDAITVNGVDYDIPVDYDDQSSYLNHYGGQMVTFGIEVPKAVDGVYDITVKIGKSEHTWIGNFLWTADPEQQYERDCHWDEAAGADVCEIRYDEEGNPIPGRDYIGHSSLALLDVSYTVSEMYYHCSAREDNAYCEWRPAGTEENTGTCNPYEDDGCGIPYLEFDSGDGEYDDGSLVVPAGATITMRVIPDYGYQVMNVNMADLEVSDNGIGEFTFTVPEGAAYFVADVVPMADVVRSGTDKVVDGSIDLGEGQTTLNHGSARLEVSDADLTDEVIAGFVGAAEGYEIKNYLDVSLFNVTCKGAEICTGSDDDSWNERIRDLNEPATVTLQLEDGVDGNEIVIVHQKHDGSYEVIPTTYDPSTQTITFTTASFSNYAIASRTVAEETTDGSEQSPNTPDTGLFTASDGGVIASIASVGLGLGLIAGLILIRKKLSAGLHS